jgi:hypothetical protein
MQSKSRFRMQIRALPALCALGVLSLGLGGCSSLYMESAVTGAGIVGAGIASQVTSNAAAATGIGLAAVAGARAGVQYTQRVAHTLEQDQIAQAAGPLQPGATAQWSVSHQVPIEDDAHGRVTVSRVISQGQLQCKEIVFSVDQNELSADSAFYLAAICQDGSTWRWASAEPATQRWGALQ